jgi:hypothetical protein
MTDHGAGLIRELEAFGMEAETAIRFFYTRRAVYAVLSEDENILAILNEDRGRYTQLGE